jgi:hypothetical protein
MSQDQPRKNQDRIVEGVLHHLRQYLSLRLQMVFKLVPKHQAILPRLVQLQLDNLAQVLVRSKAIGIDKYRVVDMLVGEDEGRRKAVLSTSDNNSILVDLLNTGGDKGKKMAEFLISDARTHMAHIDSSLEKPLLLIQHYIWWDLPDACEMFHFEEKVRSLQYIRGHRPLSDDIRQRFRTVYKMAPEAPLTDHQILAFELKGLDGVFARFSLRRAEEEPYQNILAPVVSANPNGERKILLLAQHLTARSNLLHLGDQPLEDSIRSHYGGLMSCSADAVNVEMAVAYENQQIQHLRSEMLTELLTGEEEDSTNFKMLQFGMLKQRYDAEKAATEQAMAQE